MRRLATASALEPADYRNTFSVLEDIADSVGGEYFFDQFRESLASRLGWTDSLIVDIPATMGGFPGREVAIDHFHSNRSTLFLEEYLDRWYMQNPFKTRRAGHLLDRAGHVSLRDVRAGSTIREWTFVGQYLRRHRIGDLLNGRLTGRTGGAALVCVYFDDESALREHDRALMGHLRRYLGPWLDEHFSRPRAPSRDSPPVPTGLSEREEQVAKLVADGLSNVQIARRLHITVDTVKKHLTHAMAKTGCTNRTQLALTLLGRTSMSG
ncbi:helix-turn-helix transcriptional regulator [Actinoallomurus rhizosphaericola]|uniref:helix-turn-helix transcriptional regulator n=1 Tax=Actinoallomurus rhizosphaericola TaxID=2952536 RepID=UPI002093506D|nr:response regulator transcription factor [Actinoallomurus rhizosphaericola]MCO5997881.1 response regulator transcription factor [Actinoallomurus rhizosphaericola]